MRALTPDEKDLLTHWSRFGSDGYPIRKLRAGVWVWESYRSVAGAPCTFRTRKAAWAAFERFIEILIDVDAERV